MRILGEILFVVCMVILFINKDLKGQELSKIGNNEKPLKLSGGLSVNQVFHDGSGTGRGREPYTYYLTGNIVFDLYGWSVPFSYTYSNQQTSFQQPFNQYGLHPSYKWIKTHIGYSSMNFSSYTLNGHQFLGGGVELTPGSHFKFSAMYGRLKRAIQYDTTETYAQPAYKRMGYGFKSSVNLNKAIIEIIAFRAKDELNSLSYNLDSLEIYPEENIALGFNTSVNLIDNLSIIAEYGFSYLTRDVRSEEISQSFIFNRKASTEQYDAIKGGLRFTQPNYSLGITYERIDPGYKTLGSYYITNDMEDLTGNITASLFNKKLNLGANIGVQRDDLENKKMSNMLRVVQSYNLGYIPMQGLNISANYSNFKSYSNIKSQFQEINQLTPYENLDTLNFTQISENTNLNINYVLSQKEESRQNLNFNGMYQKASEYQDQVLTNSGANFLSLNLAHNYTLVKTNTSFVTSVNYNQSTMTDIVSKTFGPVLSFRKSFLDNKLRTSLSAAYNTTYSNDVRTNSTLSFRINGGYIIKKKHNLNLSGANINRNSKRGEENKKFNEFTVTLGYSYNF